jgi:hypothetical protein
MRWPSRLPISTCGAGAHVFLAAGHHDLAVAPGDGLRGQHHGLQARAAHGIDGQGGNLFGQAGLQRGLARRVLAGARGQHLAHDDLAHLGRVDLGAGQGFLDDDGAQLGAGTLASEPPNLPTAVRAAETMTMSSILLL